MAKRFTDSEKFRDNWYRKLSPKHKCLWEFMLSECSIAGVLEVDYESMAFHIGDEISQNDLDVFSDKFYWLDNQKIFIPKFIKFQQKELSENNKAHKNIIQTLEKYNIPLDLDMSGFGRPCEGASKGLQRGTGNSKGKGNSSRIVKEKIKRPEDVNEQTWIDFLAHRKAKKAGVSETVINRIRSQANKVNWTLDEAMQEICARGWQGFNSDWVKAKPAKSNQNAINEIREFSERALNGN